MRMTMRSEIISVERLLRAGAIFLFLAGSTSLLCAKECLSVFESHKTKILSTRYFVAGGYVFGTGKMLSQSGNREIGFSKAKLDALGNISLFFESKVDWPSNYSPALRKRIWKEYLKCVSFNLVIEGNEVVYKGEKANRYTVVTAIPEQKVIGMPPAFSEIRKMLLVPENLRSGKLNLATCLELYNRNVPPSLLAEFANKLGKEYGDNVRSMLLGENAVSFIDRPKMNLENKTIHDLLILLNASPYDPELCFHIGRALAKDGLKNASTIFYARGAIAEEYSPKFAEKCRAMIPSMKKRSSILPSMLFIKNSETPLFANASLAFLNSYAGKLPVGVSEKAVDDDFLAGEDAFSRNQLAEAYTYYVKSVSIKVTFDACNMAGNAGRRIGKDREAIAFLLQATVANPSRVYPWVHLAWIYRKLGLIEQELFCIKKIKTYKLDNWSSAQLDQLEKTGKK